jgi:hypothetical protein
MRAPDSMDELLGWWERGIVTGTEFFPLLLFLIDDASVAEVMRKVPSALREKVISQGRSLCEARAAGESTVTIGEGPFADDAALEALCRWIRSSADAK